MQDSMLRRISQCHPPVSAPLFRVSEHLSAPFNAAAASHTPAVVVTVVVTAVVVSTGDSTKLNKYISK